MGEAVEPGVSALPVQFPVIGLYKEAREPNVGENFACFHNERELTTDFIVQDWREFLGMRLADAAGRSWRIAKVTRLGSKSVLLAITKHMFGWPRLRMAFQLVEEEAEPLDRLKVRLCQSIEDWQDDWRDDEAIAGESGPPRDEREMLEEVKDAVRSASSVAEIVGNLDALLKARGLA